MAGWWQ